jgi:UDP-N-acetylmuramate--alanine ligase
MLGRTRHVHFVGIGGIGMSGIAELLANLGYRVSGSDAKRSEITTRLQTAFGVTVFEGHEAAHVGDADVVVVSSAVRRSNPEIAEAERRGIPVIPRAEMLAELMRLRYAIAVAGSHGKTTTTSMIALVLERAGLDPTAVIGGRLSAFGSNARLGRGELMVAEADESDRSFLTLWPSVAVMTNVDYEHMESYDSFEALQQAFVDFGNKVPFYGAVIACADDPGLAPVIARLRRRVITYGLEHPAAGIAGSDVELGAFGGRCVVTRRSGAGSERLGVLELSVPGRHNLQNALAAVAAADWVGVEFARVAAALAGFHGAERRFERHGEAAGVLVVDDYGHHPTEIAAVLAAARATLGRRIVVGFQPHRYSRTARLLEEFGTCFGEADEIVLTDIYSAGEEPIDGVTSDRLAARIANAGRVVHVARTLDDLVTTLLKVTRPGDVVITLGAGSIGTVPARLLEALRSSEVRG